ncbi:DUF2484 family protein [Tropicimonas isoalkanivorans]|uniref:UDP-N-acetylmuramate--alanine ligase n=1 Tax=Tropicimonas isoalkanivorans TaxID=441112 RepID=A0A1I1G502_9RHOB|nr:DUF2484 family protein [Tropicimonas isoalkanivorans]SFC06581.1 Protein of unknown function [Tropicimonas isoalkanivorans]
MNALFWGCIWVVAATVVAVLPMRYQYVPGVGLLLAAPILIWQIGAAYGWPALLVAAFAFASMFRKPLRYFALRAVGRSREDARSQVTGEVTR